MSALKIYVVTHSETEHRGRIAVRVPVSFKEFQQTWDTSIKEHKGVWWQKLQQWNRERHQGKIAFVVFCDAGISAFLTYEVPITDELAHHVVSRAYERISLSEVNRQR